MVRSFVQQVFERRQERHFLLLRVRREALGKLQPDGFQLGVCGIALHQRDEAFGRGAYRDVLFQEELDHVAFDRGGETRKEVALHESEMTLDLAGECRRGISHERAVALSSGEGRAEPRAQGDHCIVLLMQAPVDLSDQHHLPLRSLTRTALPYERGTAPGFMTLTVAVTPIMDLT